MYQGTLRRSPTPRSKEPHITMKTKRKTVPLFDLPPRIKFLWKTLENQRAMVTANTAFMMEATNMSKVAMGDPVKKATRNTWLTIAPTTM
jgi:hypothetical protein